MAQPVVTCCGFLVSTVTIADDVLGIPVFPTVGARGVDNKYKVNTVVMFCACNP